MDRCLKFESLKEDEQCLNSIGGFSNLREKGSK